MSAESSAPDPVQAELAARIAHLRPRAGIVPANVLATEVDAIRTGAPAHGLYPAVAVTHAIAAALARGERGALVFGRRAILRDAVSCDRQDRTARDTDAAARSVRRTG